MRSHRIVLSLLPAVTACSGSSRIPPLTAEARVAAIESASAQLLRDTATVLDLSTEGASLEASYDGAHLRRLRATYLGEAGRAVETFYFDSTAFFVLRQEYHYDAPMSGRVQDSVVSRFDLTRTGVARAQVDSLNAAAQALLRRLRHPAE